LLDFVASFVNNGVHPAQIVESVFKLNLVGSYRSRPNVKLPNYHRDKVQCYFLVVASMFLAKCCSVDWHLVYCCGIMVMSIVQYVGNSLDIYVCGFSLGRYSLHPYVLM